MAPRRTAAKTAVNEAKEFDFDAFLAGFERPEFTRNLFRKGKLAPQIKEMEALLDELDIRIARLEDQDDDVERDITEVNPLAELVQRRHDLTAEFNKMATEFNESAVPFTFRVPDDMDDRATIKAMMDEGGFVQPDKPDLEGLPEDEAKVLQAEYDKEFEVWWDAQIMRSMCVTCVSHQFDLDQWIRLRKTVGEVAFSALAVAWAEAVQAATPASPFLLRRSTGPETTVSSAG